MHFLKTNFYSIPVFIIAFFSLLLTSCGSHKELSKSEEKSSNTTSSSKKITKKYAELLGVEERDIDNAKLYAFIDEWYGTPYKYGGKNKSGIDCSNFSAQLYSTIYHKTLTGSSASIFKQCKSVSRNDLREGDLVFFKIENNEISHIGIYLQNNKFVHATTKKGVMINDLNEAYYKKYYFKGGRINDQAKN